MITIYRFFCDVDGRSYIGQTRNFKRRFSDHTSHLASGTHDNKRLQEAWNTYGHEHFRMEIIDTQQCSQEEADELETYWIEYFDANNPACGFNIASGGTHGYSMYSMSDEEKAEIRHRQSLTCIEKYKEKPGPMAGKHLTDETKEKLRAANSGCNNFWYGRRRPEHSVAMSGAGNPRAKKVLCLTTGEVFPCAKFAAEKYNTTNSNILKCCRGTQRSAGKLDGVRLVWQYAN